MSIEKNRQQRVKKYRDVIIANGREREMTIIFAEQLRQLRREISMTQKQLADVLETTQRNISYLELGKVEPDLKTLWKIADFFDVSVDFLIGRKDA